MADTRTLGNYISDKRRSSGLTQKDLLIRLASYGYHYSDGAVNQWEKDRGVPPIHDPKFVHALAEVLGVQDAEILEVIGFEIKNQDIPKWLQDFLDTATPEELKMMRVFLETLKKMG